MYVDEYPNVDDLVVVQVKSIVEMQTVVSFSVANKCINIFDVNVNVLLEKKMETEITLYTVFN